MVQMAVEDRLSFGVIPDVVAGCCVYTWEGVGETLHDSYSAHFSEYMRLRIMIVYEALHIY